MGKAFEKLIEDKKSAILKSWMDAAINSYAPDTAAFLKGQKDPFSNPVGGTTLKGLQVLLDQLLSGMDPEIINSHLDPIIRIRAVQNFTPSQATAFILTLKTVLKNTFKKELQDSQVCLDFLEFESKIDQLSLLAFDIFMQCKEKIYHIKANENRSRTFRAFERAGLIAEDAEHTPADMKS